MQTTHGEGSPCRRRLVGSAQLFHAERQRGQTPTQKGRGRMEGQSE